MPAPPAPPAGAPWDPGLQSERTGLAWQRTLLSGLACSLLVTRLLTEISIALAVVVGLCALLGTAVLGVLAVDRFRRNDEAIRLGHPIGGGTPYLLLSGLVVLTALGALLYVVVV